MFLCYWSWMDVALSVLFTESDSMKKNGQGAVFWINMNTSNVFDRFVCCWLSQVIVSMPLGGWQRPDRQTVQACMPLLTPKARSLWKAHRERVSIGIETQVYFFSACQNAKGREHERHRDRERGHLKASVVSSGGGQPKHFRAVRMGF